MNQNAQPLHQSNFVGACLLLLGGGLHGTLLAALFLFARRVIWAPYIAQGLANTIALLLIYYGIYEQWL